MIYNPNSNEVQFNPNVEEYNRRSSLNPKEIISKYQTPKFLDILDDKNKFNDKDPERSKNNNNYNILCKPKKEVSNISPNGYYQKDKENINQNRNQVDFEIINYRIKNSTNNFPKGNVSTLNPNKN